LIRVQTSPSQSDPGLSHTRAKSHIVTRVFVSPPEGRRVRLGDGLWVEREWWRWDEGRKEMLDGEGRSWRR